MTFEPLQWAKAHPYTAAGIGFVAVLGLYFVLSGSSAPSAASGSSNDDAELQAEEQLAQTQAQAQNQQAQYDAQLTAQQENDSANETLAQYNAAVQEYTAGLSYETAVDQTNGQVAEATLTNNATMAGIAANEAVSVDQINANESINNTIQQSAVTETQLNDSTQQAIAQATDQVEGLISTNQSNVSIQQASDQAAVSEALIGSQETQGILGSAGGIIGGLGGLAAAFL